MRPTTDPDFIFQYDWTEVKYDWTEVKVWVDCQLYSTGSGLMQFKVNEKNEVWVRRFRSTKEYKKASKAFVELFIPRYREIVFNKELEELICEKV